MMNKSVKILGSRQSLQQECEERIPERAKDKRINEEAK